MSEPTEREWLEGDYPEAQADYETQAEDNLCPHCGHQASLGKTGKVLSHSGPKAHEFGCSQRGVSGGCSECGLAVYKDGRRCPGTYKRPVSS